MKKTISLLLSLILAFSAVSSIQLSAFAECEHNYELKYDYNEESKELSITPVCTLCEATDDENKLVFSNFVFDSEAMSLSADINNPENKYLTELGLNKYVSEGKVAVSRTDAMAFLYSVSNSISDEDKAAFAEQLGVDSRLFTCSHKGITDVNNYSLSFDDKGVGVGSFVCPDCGLEYSIHFSITNVDINNKTATISVPELGVTDKTIDISFLVDLLASQLGGLSGQNGGSGAPGGLTPEKIAMIMQLIGGSGGQSGYPGMGGGSGGSSFKLPKSKIKKIKSLRKGLKVSFKKIEYVSGYQIQYSTSKKFTKKTTKKVTVKGTKKSSKTIKKLKAKKKYYVRIRTYFSFNGKKVYSKWSKKVAKKTK